MFFKRVFFRIYLNNLVANDLLPGVSEDYNDCAYHDSLKVFYIRDEWKREVYLHIYVVSLSK